MVGMGVLMIALGVWSLWLRYQQRLFHSRLPVERPGDGAGRTAGAVGRLDHDRSGTSALGHLWFLRTRDAVSLHSTAQMVVSLLVFIVVYCSVFGVGYYYIVRLIKKGPQPVSELTSSTSGTPARPLSAAEAVPEEETR